MMLSMWILAGWLSKYSPRLEIIEGDATISGVRFIAEEMTVFSKDYVYIGHMSETTYDSNYVNITILVHGHDIIFINNSNTELLINEVLAAFDYFSEWEHRLWEASSASEDALQQMLDLSDGIFNQPARIMDYTGKILAISRMYLADPVNERWRKLYESRIVQLSDIGTPIITMAGEVITEWTNEPREYYTEERLLYIAATIQADEENIAIFLMEQSQTSFTKAHCQLAAVFCEILETSAQIKNNSLKLCSKASILLGLLDGRPPNADTAAKLNAYGGSPPWILLTIRCICASAPLIRRGSMLTLMRESGLPNISFIYGEDILTVISTNIQSEYIQRLDMIINTRFYSIGISFPFALWNDIPIRYKQASFALSHGQGRHGIYNCKDYALDHLVSVINDYNYNLELIHPALLVLKEYDKVHHTDFYGTLYKYLLNERNLAAAAKDLYVHRNTLMYRINRILDIIGTDLNHPDDRIFLLLSYKMQDQKQ